MGGCALTHRRTDCEPHRRGAGRPQGARVRGIAGAGHVGDADVATGTKKPSASSSSSGGSKSTAPSTKPSGVRRGRDMCVPVRTILNAAGPRVVCHTFRCLSCVSCLFGEGSRAFLTRHSTCQGVGNEEHVRGEGVFADTRTWRSCEGCERTEGGGLRFCADGSLMGCCSQGRRNLRRPKRRVFSHPLSLLVEFP